MPWLEQIWGGGKHFRRFAKGNPLGPPNDIGLREVPPPKLLKCNILYDLSYGIGNPSKFENFGLNFDFRFKAEIFTFSNITHAGARNSKIAGTPTLKFIDVYPLAKG